MFSRRELVTGGLAAATLSHTANLHASTSAGSDDNTGILNDILNQLRSMAARELLPGAREIEMVRQSQRTFLKQAGKFPDQIEVGLDVWERVIDWFVATRQPVDVVRLADGRYAIKYVTTNIVVKHELPENYVSPGQ